MPSPPPNYITIDDVIAAGVSQEIIDGIEGDVPTVLARILGMANKRSRYADGYLGRVFTMPIVEWGDDLRLAVGQLTGWDVMSITVGFNPESPSGVTWRDRRDEAQRWLERVASEDVVPTDIVDSSEDDDDPTTGQGFEMASDESRGW